MTEELLELETKLKPCLDKYRYDHTIGVMHTAACLSMKYAADLRQSMIAGLLHDCAKCIPTSQKYALCKKYHIEISEAEMVNPGLLHAKLGAYLARSQYGIGDEEVLHAISVHTTGCPGMTLLDKILYIADYIEPGRKDAANLPVIRKLAFSDLDACLYQILQDSLEYLKQKDCVIDSMTEQTFLYYDNLFKTQKITSANKQLVETIKHM